MNKCFFIVGVKDPLWQKLADSVQEIKKHLKPDNFNESFEVVLENNVFTVYVTVKEPEEF